MAVNYTSHTYTLPFDSRLPLYGSSSHSSPTSTNSTAGNNSPESPRLSHLKFESPVKQLRQPRTPLYIPAVLRPTEFSSTRPHETGLEGSFGSQESIDDAEIEAEIFRRAVREGKTIQELVEQEHWLVSEDHLGKVTGLPTREHWKPDAASSSCDSPKCRSSFSLFTRKHHCRHCGHIFCAVHAPHSIPLDQEARFHPNGNLSRACEHCFYAWRRWEIARGIACREVESASDPKEANDEHLIASTSRDIRGKSLKPTEEIAASVPKDWAWSTF